MTIFSQILLKQLIDSSTRITEKTSTLIDHILINSFAKISQFGILEISLSDHQAIFCTRKMVKEKFHKHKFIKIRSLKRYSKELLLEKLESIQFPDYSSYNNVDRTYSDFIDKTTIVINEVAPFKQVCIKNSACECVDEDVLWRYKSSRQLARDKLFSKFKKTRQHNDNLKYKRARNLLQHLIKKKNRNFITSNLNENIVRPKELRKTLQKIRSPSKK